MIPLRLLAPFLAAILCLSACGKDSSSDISNRDRDREREKSESVFDEYHLAEGLYSGKMDQGDVTLDLKTSWTKPDGGTTANPALLGSLVFYPMMIMGGQDPLQMSFPVDDGTYSKISGSLSLNVASGDKSTKLVCQTQAESALDCRWYTPRGELNIQFKKIATTSAAIKRMSGVYSGSVDAFNVDAKFDTLYTKNSSGRIVQAVIAGQFIFSMKNDHSQNGSPHSVIFRSVDGSFDFFKNAVNFNIDGDTPILVTCQIHEASQLHCLWSATHSYEFDLKLKENTAHVKP